MKALHLLPLCREAHLRVDLRAAAAPDPFVERLQFGEHLRSDLVALAVVASALRTKEGQKERAELRAGLAYLLRLLRLLLLRPLDLHRHAAAALGAKVARDL